MDKPILKPAKNPLLDSLPEFLKDPANYDKVQLQILESFRSNCGHSEVIEWASCKICSDKMLDRRRLLEKLGFKNPNQYYAWRKTHEKIKELYPLVDWKYKPIIT